jgi:spermidine/putrescine transport system substrate-binding protein
MVGQGLDGTEGGRDGSSMTRSRFLVGVGAGLATAAVGAKESRAALFRGRRAPAFPTAPPRGGTLNVYSWPNYFSKENLSGYTAQTGTKITVAAYESPDAAFAKLAASKGGGYDLLVPTSAWIQVMADKGLLVELDHSRVPLRYVDRAFLNKPFDPGNHYSIPKDYGVVGVTYDPAAVGGEIKTWQDFLDAGTKPSVSGKLDPSGASHLLLGIALWASGKDWLTTDKKVLRDAANTMKGFAKHVKEFSGFDIPALVNGSLVMSVTDQGVGRQAILQNRKLRFVVPRPHSELWVDNYSIIAASSNQDRAYGFISYQLQPAHQIRDSAFIGYPTVLPGLRGKLPSKIPLAADIFVPRTVLPRLQEWIIRPSLQGTIENLTSQIKAAAGG